MDISQHTRERNVATPQASPLPGRELDQVANSAGGFTFTVDKWTHLLRFLVLGSEGGTYYVGERDLTKTNHDNLLACIQEDARRAIALAVDVSVANRAPKNDYAIYVVALAAAKALEVADRQFAFESMRSICRIGTHLFQFAQFYTAFRGWSRSARKGVAQWYLERSETSLANQLLKYQSRNGWAHRDLLRLAHVKPKTPSQAALFKWAVDGTVPEHPLIQAHAEVHAKKVDMPLAVLLDKISTFKLTHEMLPSEVLKDPKVWEAMLPHMGAHAIIRSLGRMTSIGLLERFGDGVQAVTDRIVNREFLKGARVHPFALLLALGQYQQGRGDKESLTWNPNPRTRRGVALFTPLRLSLTTVGRSTPPRR